jgi:hypothetical protein
VSENRLLRRMFTPNKEKATVGWRKLLNEEVHNLHSSLKYENDQIKKDEMDGAYTRVMHGRAKKCIHILVRKPEGKRSCYRIVHRWEGVYWIYLVQSSEQWEALVDTVMNFWVP